MPDYHAGELRISHEALQALLDLLPQIIIVWDARRRVALANSKAAEVFGVDSPADLVGRHKHEVIAPEFLLTAEQSDNEVLSTGRPTELPIIAQRFVDGSLHYLQVFKHALPLMDGQSGVLVVASDLTGREQAELNQQQLSAQLRQVFDLLAHYIVVWDEQGRVMLANAAFAHRHGFPDADSVITRHKQEFMDAAQVSLSDEADARVRRTGEHVKLVPEPPYFNPDGSSIWLDITKAPFLLADGRTGVLSVAADITERRQYEQRLHQMNEELRQLIDLLPERIVIWDEDDHLLLTNAAFAAGWGLPSTRAAEGRSMCEVIGPGVYPWSRDSNAEVRQTGRRLDMPELWMTERDGSQRCYRVIKIPLFRPGHTLPAVLTAAHDITERKQHEQELLRLNAELEGRVLDRTTDLLQANRDLQHAKEIADSASAAKSLFLATMSHEIRTPMNGVIGMLELALQNPLAPDQMDLLSTALDSAHTLLHILDDILDLSKIESSKLALEHIPLDFGRLVLGVVATVTPGARQKQLELRTAVDSRLPQAILGDPVRLRQILFNLLNNAIKFSTSIPGQRRDITVEVVVEDLSDATVSVLLLVRDNGIGMDASQLARLFQPFSQAEASITRRFGGTGLGLSICKRLVDLMGGEISVDSSPGQGSTFRVQLAFPRADVADIGDAAQESDGPAWRPLEEVPCAEAAGRLILYVEDNAVNQKVCLHQLSWLGHPCLVAANGREALEIWQKRRIGLVLTDVHMPEMDGLTLTQEIRRDETARGLAKTPVIAMTASALAEEMQRCREAGVNEVIAKPLRLAHLQQCLDRWLPLTGKRVHSENSPG